MQLRRLGLHFLTSFILATGLLSGVPAQASLLSCIANFFRSPEPVLMPENLVFGPETAGLYESIRPQQRTIAGLELNDNITQQNEGTLMETYIRTAGNTAIPTNRGNHVECLLQTNYEGKRTLFMKEINLKIKEILPSLIHSDSLPETDPGRGTRLSTFLFLRQMKALKIPKGGLSSVHAEGIENAAAVFEWNRIRKNWYHDHPGEHLRPPEASKLIAGMKSLEFVKRPLWESGHKIVALYLNKKFETIEVKSLRDHVCAQSAQHCAAFDAEMTKNGFHEYDTIVSAFSIDFQLAPR